MVGNSSRNCDGVSRRWRWPNLRYRPGRSDRRSVRARTGQESVGARLGRVRPNAGNQQGAGRDHWPSSMSALLAGGVMKMGQVIGSADRGRRPKDAVHPNVLPRSTSTWASTTPRRSSTRRVGRFPSCRTANRLRNCSSQPDSTPLPARLSSTPGRASFAACASPSNPLAFHICRCVESHGLTGCPEKGVTLRLFEEHQDGRANLP